MPATNPILTVPSGGATIAGFIFTNPYTSPINVTIYRDGISAAQAVFTVAVPALAGVPGGPAAVVQLQALGLSAGETIFAQSATLGGLVNVEIDGISSGSTQGLSTNQFLEAILLQQLGQDIPDANMLASLGYNF